MFTQPMRRKAESDLTIQNRLRDVIAASDVALLIKGKQATLQQVAALYDKDPKKLAALADHDTRLFMKGCKITLEQAEALYDKNPKMLMDLSRSNAQSLIKEGNVSLEQVVALYHNDPKTLSGLLLSPNILHLIRDCNVSLEEAATLYKKTPEKLIALGTEAAQIHPKPDKAPIIEETRKQSADEPTTIQKLTSPETRVRFVEPLPSGKDSSAENLKRAQHEQSMNSRR